MERIEMLIHKLKQQFDENADSAKLLLTVQALQLELTKKIKPQQALGTSKVAVVLPSSTIQVAVKHTTKTTDEVSIIKETLLLEDDQVSVVQKNGQLDMVFDPLKEIPTLSHQPAVKEVNELIIEAQSINDKLKVSKTELIEVLKESPVKDLRKAVGINDRFLFINELFRGDETMYERSIKTINNFSIYPEAEYWINRELKVKLGWERKDEVVQLFDQLVKRRFS